MVDQLKEQYNAQVEWRPFELHPEIPGDGWAVPPHIQDRYRERAKWLLERAQTGWRAMVIPTKVSSSRRALEAAEFARKHGKHEEFHSAVFRKYYGEGQDIYRWEVLCSAAEEIGLDPQMMQKETMQGKNTAIVDQYLREAQKRRIRSVPTFILNDRLTIIGAQPYNYFQQAIRQIQRKKK